MRIKLEDYFGNDICEIKIKSTHHTEEALHNIIETDEYNIADLDEDWGSVHKTTINKLK